METKNTFTIVKMGLAVMLFLCLLRMPYGYFQFVRIAGCVGFIYLLFSKDNIYFKIAWIVSIILLNPIFKIIIHKHDWHIIDVIIAIFLLISAFSKK